MGVYINPKDCSKEEFLEKHGVLFPQAPTIHRNGEYVAVCLVDNGWMTAAGICYSERELAVFAYEDGRPKRWFAVPLSDLAPFIKPEDVEP